MKFNPFQVHEIQPGPKGSPGKLLGSISLPSAKNITSCTFGGDDLRTLYITAGGTLWTLRTLTPGHVAWPWR